MPVYNYTTLDDPLATTIGTVANGINATGQIVGNYYTASGEHGFSRMSATRRGDARLPDAKPSGALRNCDPAYDRLGSLAAG
jgi:uncharacterized membrane protein